MFIKFVIEYWYLFAMLAVVIILLCFDPVVKGASVAKMVSPLHLPQIQSRKSAIVVDVNEPKDYKHGHIVQSINLPISKISNSLGVLKQKKDKPIIITCETGGNSSRAAAVLRKNDFTDLYILNGGLAAWKKENLPLEKSKSSKETLN